MIMMRAKMKIGMRKPVEGLSAIVLARKTEAAWPTIFGVCPVDLQGSTSHESAAMAIFASRRTRTDNKSLQERRELLSISTGNTLANSFRVETEERGI